MVVVYYGLSMVILWYNYGCILKKMGGLLGFKRFYMGLIIKKILVNNLEDIRLMMRFSRVNEDWNSLKLLTIELDYVLYLLRCLEVKERGYIKFNDSLGSSSRYLDYIKNNKDGKKD